MKTIIAVRGAANSGKTRSIRKAYQLLSDEHPTAKIEEIRNRVDIAILMTINGVKVGIESQGDQSDRLSISLKRFIEAKCKVIICATRTRGMTVRAVSDLVSQYQIKWIEKVKLSNAKEHQAANKLVARKIFMLAQAAINE